MKYRDYKTLTTRSLDHSDFNYINLRTFKETVFNIFNKYVPIKSVSQLL